MTIEIVLLAMVAAFLGLRLYSVLGKRTGHEQEHTPRNIEPNLDKRSLPEENRDGPVPDIVPAPRRKPAAPEMVYEPAAEPGMRAILTADRNFDVARFMEGAKAAYEMILEAFWKGEREELKSLCDEDVYESFVAAIDAREKNGEILDNRLVRIEDIKIVSAEYERPIARITVRYDADIAAVVRDKDGKLIGGSLSDAVETHDVWTFARDLSSADPNWILDETDEA